MQQAQFNHKILPYKDQMYRLALRILRNEDDAKDIVQDSLLKLWNKRKVLEDISSLKSFSLTIVRNASIDFIRKKKPEYNQYKLVAEKTDLMNPEKQLEVSDQLKRVKKIINQLNDSQRELIQLREIEGLEFEEISEITGLTVNNIRVIISRARKEIRQQMIAEMNFENIKNN